jgi:RNA polymerase sigma factor (sigma-70 family)
MHLQSNKELWKRLRNGDHEALREIYERNIQSVYNYGCRFTTDEHLVKDCIHEIFIDIFRNRKNLGDTDNIRLYLFKSVKRKIIRVLKYSIKGEPITREYDFLLSAGSQEEKIIAEETSAIIHLRLNKAISGLSPRQKEAIFLRYIEEMSYGDICRIMEMEYQSARNLVSSAIKKLQHELENNP